MPVTLGAGGYVDGLTAYTADAGSDRQLIFLAMWEVGFTGSAVITALTYGGVAMTKVTGIVLANRQGCSIWRLSEASIPAGANNFVPTHTNPPGVQIRYTACTLIDVDQTTPVADSGTDSETAIKVVQVDLTVSADSYSIANASDADNNATETWTLPYTERKGESVNGVRVSIGDNSESSGGISSAICTFTGAAARTVMSAANFAPVSAPPTVSIIYPCCAQLIS